VANAEYKKQRKNMSQERLEDGRNSVGVVNRERRNGGGEKKTKGAEREA
jgi:hypothetical protein